MNQQHKREQVEAIDDEVNGLHPLLHEILQKIAHVSYVEYTHGPNELGADFVVLREDPAIKETSFIGVIAKTDRILQSTTDVERQIEECNLKRPIRQGKQEVRLSEIWVITSKSVSHNAKLKIQEKYAGRKVFFFDADWLVDQVDTHAPYFWYRLPNATGGYLSNLSIRVAQLNAQTSLLPHGVHLTTYIDLDVAEAEADRYKKQSIGSKPRLVNLLEEACMHKLAILEADMGFGKSTLVRRIVAELAVPEVYKERKTLPIYLSFSRFAEKEYISLEDRLKDL